MYPNVALFQDLYPIPDDMYPNVALFQDLYPTPVILYTEMESLGTRKNTRQ